MQHEPRDRSSEKDSVKRKSKPRFRLFLQFVIVTVLTIVLIEAVARIVVFKWVPFSPTDSAGVHFHAPDGLGDLKPSKNSILIPSAFYGGARPLMPYSFRTNSQGLRELRDYAVPKPKGIIRILCVGDSYTEGALVHNHNTYPALLNSRILRGSEGFEVINAGGSGYSIRDELAYLKEKGLYLEPNIVILQVFTNDLSDLRDELKGERGQRPQKQSRTKRSLRDVAYTCIQYSATVRLGFWMVWRRETPLPEKVKRDRALAQQKYIEFIYKKSDPARMAATKNAYEEGFREFRDATKKAGARLIVIHVPDYMQVTTDLPNTPQQYFRKLGEKFDVPYVDLLPVFKSYPVESDFIYLMPENGHLSRLGNWIMAKEAGRGVMNLIPKTKDDFHPGYQERPFSTLKKS